MVLKKHFFLFTMLKKVVLLNLFVETEIHFFRIHSLNINFKMCHHLFRIKFFL